MSLRKLFCTALPVAAALAVWVAGSPAHAASLALNFDGAANTKGPFTNPGAAPVDVNKFSVNLDIDPASQLQVAGNFNISISMSANLGISGATFSPTGNLNIPYQTPNLTTTGAANITTTPTGSASLTLWGQQVGGFDPGGDGFKSATGVPSLPSTLSRADLTAFQTTLIGSSGASVSTNPITITGSGGIDLSLFTLGLDAKLIGSAKVGLSNLAYQQTSSGDAMVGNGLPGLLPPGNNATRSYPLDTNAWGDLTGAGTASVGGVVILDSDLGNLGTFNLGDLINQSINLDSAFPLPGTVTLADLNPTGFNQVNKDDLQASIGLDLTGIGLPFSLSSVGTATIATQVVTTTTLVAPITITISVTGTITFGILASLLANDMAYQLQDSIANVVAPEPGSIMLLFMGLAGAVPLALRRRRRRK